MGQFSVCAQLENLLGLGLGWSREVGCSPSHTQPANRNGLSQVCWTKTPFKLHSSRLSTNAGIFLRKTWRLLSLLGPSLEPWRKAGWSQRREERIPFIWLQFDPIPQQDSGAQGPEVGLRHPPRSINSSNLDPVCCLLWEFGI